MSDGEPTTAYPGCVPVLTGQPYAARDGSRTQVRLRAHSPDDAPGMLAQARDPESQRFTGAPRDCGPERVQGFLAQIRTAWEDPDGARYWAVEWWDPDDAGSSPRFTGTVDLRPRGQGSAEIGYGLHPDARGRGVMAQAVRLACRWWFDQGGRRVTWMSHAGHLASWRVAWACGFRRHGELPEYLPHPDGLQDAWTASVGADDDLERPAHPWIDPPVLSAGPVRLRPLRDGDTAIAEPHDHPSHHLPARAIPTPETFTRWLARRRDLMSQGGSLNWCIADARTDEPLGEMLVFVHQGLLTEGGTAELGYFLKPSARGRGLIVPAGQAAVRHALAPFVDGGLGLRRVVAETAADNAASNRVLESLGFTRWGHEASAEAPDGSWGPADHWELLAG